MNWLRESVYKLWGLFPLNTEKLSTYRSPHWWTWLFTVSIAHMKNTWFINIRVKIDLNVFAIPFLILLLIGSPCGRFLCVAWACHYEQSLLTHPYPPPAPPAKDLLSSPSAPLFQRVQNLLVPSTVIIAICNLVERNKTHWPWGVY